MLTPGSSGVKIPVTCFGGIKFRCGFYSYINFAPIDDTFTYTTCRDIPTVLTCKCFDCSNHLRWFPTVSNGKGEKNANYNLKKCA